MCLFVVQYIAFKANGYRRSNFAAIKDDFWNIRKGLRRTVLNIESSNVKNIAPFEPVPNRLLASETHRDELKCRP